MPGPCTEGLVQGRDAGEGREPALPGEDISARCVIRELSPKEDINKGRFFPNNDGKTQKQ